MKCKECRSVVLDPGMHAYGFIGWCKYLLKVKPFPPSVVKVFPVSGAERDCDCFSPSDGTPETIDSRKVAPYEESR